jgi:phospholipid/cholesterol/gamma-HCH transport system substrate-binding protein
MSEKTIRRKLAVGIFIFAGLAIMAAGIFVVGGQRKTFIKSVRARVIFDDIQGLQTGNNVWLSGMKIGTVKKISFYGNTQVEVILSIEHQAQPHIRKDARARVGTDGLVGNKIVIISGGSDDLPPIADNDTLQSEHVAGAQEMLSTLQASNGNLLAITGNLKAITQRLTTGQGTLGALINDPAIADQIKASVTNLRAATAGSQKMIASLEDFTGRLQKPGGLANELVNDTVILSRIRNSVTKLNEAANAASQFGSSLRAAGEGLNNPNAPVGLLLHDEDVAADLQRTIKNLRVSSQELSDDLEAVQHSWLLRGFFKKKKD